MIAMRVPYRHSPAPRAAVGCVSRDLLRADTRVQDPGDAGKERTDVVLAADDVECSATERFAASRVREQRGDCVREGLGVVRRHEDTCPMRLEDLRDTGDAASDDRLAE